MILIKKKTKNIHAVIHHSFDDLWKCYKQVYDNKIPTELHRRFILSYDYRQNKSGLISTQNGHVLAHSLTEKERKRKHEIAFV